MSSTKKDPTEAGSGWQSRRVRQSLKHGANNCSCQWWCASVHRCTGPDPDLCRNAQAPMVRSPNNCSLTFVLTPNMFVSSPIRSKTNIFAQSWLCMAAQSPIPSPKLCAFLHRSGPDGGGGEAHYFPLPRSPASVRICCACLFDPDQILFGFCRCYIDHPVLGFFHDFAEFRDDLFFGHGVDVLVGNV